MKLLKRPRRLRQSDTIREMVAETRYHPSQLILPVFVKEGKGLKEPLQNLPSAFTFSIDKLIEHLKNVEPLGIRSVVLFGVSDKRDANGSEALNPDGVIPKTIKEIRSQLPNFFISTDIALDPYTDHGHDGLYKDGKILNDESVEVLCKMSELHAKAGAQNVSPSDMMDGRIQAIREHLDTKSLEETTIMSYTAKYASCMYGPFRDALGAAPVSHKKTYQMDPRNRREALKELHLDLEEGADIVMVKPASLYLDIISDFKKESHVPVAAYQVSGECALLELGASQNLFDRKRAILESIHSIRRAGADLILTYFAEDLAKWCGESNAKQ